MPDLTEEEKKILRQAYEIKERIIPSEQEMEENSRSKSAKLRVFEKA